jgi:hypothetical protein
MKPAQSFRSSTAMNRMLGGASSVDGGRVVHPPARTDRATKTSRRYLDNALGLRDRPPTPRLRRAAPKLAVAGFHASEGGKEPGPNGLSGSRRFEHRLFLREPERRNERAWPNVRGHERETALSTSSPLRNGTKHSRRCSRRIARLSFSARDREDTSEKSDPTRR